jgi:hypothetical protein
MATIGVKDFYDKKFKQLEFEGEWERSFGKPEKNFRTLIYGLPKNGKTEFCIKLSKYLTGFTKVYYNSYEQGISKSLQDALKRNNMRDVSGKIIFGDGERFEQMKARLSKKNSPGACFIDSLDYMKLGTEQYQDLVNSFPNKIFIIICWARGSKPAKQAALDIEYMVDVIVKVKDFKAYVASRFGGCEPFVIWDKGATKKAPEVKQIDLFKAAKSA